VLLTLTPPSRSVANTNTCSRQSVANTNTSAGISPTATPIIGKMTVRESLFLDFEDVERQVMAGDESLE